MKNERYREKKNDEKRISTAMRVYHVFILFGSLECGRQLLVFQILHQFRPLKEVPKDFLPFLSTVVETLIE